MDHQKHQTNHQWYLQALFTMKLVEHYLNANLILNIGPESINTPLHQNWIHRRRALIQTALDGVAQKRFSVIPIDMKFRVENIHKKNFKNV